MKTWLITGCSTGLGRSLALRTALIFRLDVTDPGSVTAPGAGYYAASKCALEGMTEGLRLETAPLGIKVMIVEPGAFRTDFAGRSLTQSKTAIADYAGTAGKRRIENDKTHGTQQGDPNKGARLIVLKKQAFGDCKISRVKTSDAKLFLIKLQQEDNKRYSTIKTVRGVLRPAFQMAVDDDVLNKNPFGFELAGVVVNDSVTREAVTKDQMRKFLKFVHDDVVYCKYYEVVYILFHTGMRISEFCGLTLSDIDMENKIINIDHQLQRSSKMEYIIESTKTNAGTRKLPMTDDVAQCFRAIIEDREPPEHERIIDGYGGFLFTDKKGYPEVAMHWEHRFKHMLNRYNEIYRVQMPKITPHVCRHTYCSNMAKAGMNPKTLQYLMGHSDIGVTLNTYTHLGLEDAEGELKRMEGLESARKELDKAKGAKAVSQKMFRAI